MNLQSTSSPYNQEGGFVYVFCAVIMLVLFGVGSFVIDIGYAHYNERYLQNAADASAIAGLAVLGPSTNLDTVRTRTNAIATANGLTPSTSGSKEIDEPTCGQWAPAHSLFLPVTCGATANAVQVKTYRSRNTVLGKMFGVNSLRPVTRATAYAPMSGGGPCVTPFGVETTFITGVSTGSNFEITTAASGNWGKIKTWSTGSNSLWPDKMVSTDCDPAIAVNEPVEVIPGNKGQTGAVFQGLLLPSPYRQMFVPITSTFSGGNSDGGEVTIYSYALISLIAVLATNGQNFEMTLRLDALNATPPIAGGNPTIGSRALVR